MRSPPRVARCPGSTPFLHADLHGALNRQATFFGCVKRQGRQLATAKQGEQVGYVEATGPGISLIVMCLSEFKSLLEH
jgi:hypothetical protein